MYQHGSPAGIPGLNPRFLVPPAGTHHDRVLTLAAALVLPLGIAGATFVHWGAALLCSDTETGACLGTRMGSLKLVSKVRDKAGIQNG